MPVAFGKLRQLQPNKNILNILLIFLLVGGTLLAAYLFTDTSKKIEAIYKNGEENSLWVISQIDTEFHRMRASLALHMLNIDDIDTVSERLDILYSRSKLLDTNAVSELHDFQTNENMKKQIIGILDKIDIWLNNGHHKEEIPKLLEELFVVSSVAREYAIESVHRSADRSTSQKMELVKVEHAAQVSFYSVLTIMFLTLIWLAWQIRESHKLTKKLFLNKEELEQTVIKLEKANAAKSDFLANMSHELRTPLNGIIGMSDMMCREMLGDISEDYKEYANDIKTSGKHLLDLINDILDLSKIDSGKFKLFEENISLYEETKTSAGFVSQRAKEGNVSVFIQETNLSVFADKLRYRQIITNIVSNAVKFTPSQGSVFIKFQEDENYIHVTIEDTGCGMTEEQVISAMEPFSQVSSDPHKTKEGTGLGLPLTKKLVELHNGKLKIESIVEKGTSVHISFPKTDK